MSIIFEYEKPLEFVAVSLTLSQTELLFLSTGTDTTCAHIRLICGLWYVPPNVSLSFLLVSNLFSYKFSFSQIYQKSTTIKQALGWIIGSSCGW